MVAFLIFRLFFLCKVFSFTCYSVTTGAFVFVSVCFVLVFFCLFAYTGSTADVEEICDDEAGEINVVVAVPCGRPRYFSS